MAHSTARDLLLLAATAFRHQKFQEAGTLFAASLSSSDSVEFLESLDPEGVLQEDLADAWGVGLGSDAPRTGLRSIGETLGDAMAALANDSDPLGDVENPIPLPHNESDGEGEDDDEDENSATSELAGVSLSSEGNQGGGPKSSNIRLVLSASSPIRVGRKD